MRLFLIAVVSFLLLGCDDDTQVNHTTSVNEKPSKEKEEAEAARLNMNKEQEEAEANDE